MVYAPRDLVSVAPPRSPERGSPRTWLPTLLGLLFALGSAVLAFAPVASAAPAPSEPYFTRIAAEPLFARDAATATPLPGGKVLIAGGGETLTLRTAEIFDPATDTFSEVHGLTRHIRSAAVAAPLPDGRVLIAGGSKNVSYTVAEYFDPTTEAFSEVPGEMTVARLRGIAAPLPDGDVLIAGGFSEGESQRSAELFHPASGTFTALASRPTAERSGAVAAELPDGRVLIVGGEGNEKQSAEVFDPATETFSAFAPTFTGAEYEAAGALLADGKMLVSGGIRRGGPETSEADVFDPAVPALEPLSVEATTPRAGAVAALLPEGKVLISGGGWPEAGQSAELFVPAAEIGYSGADLGAQLVGQSTGRRTVLVTNVGAQPLEIDSVTLTGDPTFAIDVDACSGRTLAFGASCAIGIDFTPTTVGSAAATLEFVDNEATPKSVPLTASGYLPTEPPPPGPVSPSPIAVAPPTPKHPASPNPHHSRSVGCVTKRLNSRRVQVTCRVHLAAGAWEARLLHAGKVLAQRRVGPGTRRLVFTRGAPAREERPAPTASWSSRSARRRGGRTGSSRRSRTSRRRG